MKKAVSLVTVALMSFCQMAEAQIASANLKINEVMSRNIDLFIDPSYNYGGWIEIFNPTSSAINLSGLCISDDPTNYKKFSFPSSIGTVPANGYKTIWFDHYSTSNEYSTASVTQRQVPFKLNPEGGTLYISTSGGNPIIVQSYPAMPARISFARTTDGGDQWRLTSSPTPAASNTTSVFADEQLNAPVVDRNGAVYSTGFKVHVGIPDGATLRYTTDGSTPTSDNGQTSADGVFEVGGEQNYVFRFRLYKEGMLPSDVVTRTYIYNKDNYYLPVVSIVTDDKNLYDNRIGAYVDGTNGIGGNGGNGNQNSNKNRGWERPVNFEYLVPNTDKEYSMVLNQEVDFQVSGGWSRHFPPNSSFKLKSSKQYGINELPFPFFGQKPYIKNKAIIVRNGGNDADCRIFDAAIHQILLTSGFYIDCQDYQPAHIFINGEYQFMFNLREPNNKNFGYSNYGIDKDEMDQLEYSGGYKLKVGSEDTYVKWGTLANNLASTPSNESIYQQICDIADMDEVINYFAAQCYVGSNDWISNNNNIKIFRAWDNGKFHIVFMDVDQGFYWIDMITRINGSGGWGGWGGFNAKSFPDLFLNMLKHEGFKKKFIDAFCVVAGSVFDKERAKAIINKMAAYSERALALDDKNPWKADGKYNGADMDISGNVLMNAVTNDKLRKARITTIQNYFNLEKSYDVSISSNLPQAVITLNETHIPTGKLDGTIFAPAKLTTEAPAGYRFVGWRVSGGTGSEIISTNSTWEYYDKGSLDGKEWMSESYNSGTWPVGNAPLGYGNIIGVNNQTGVTTKISYGTDAGNKQPTYYFRRQFRLSKAPNKNQTYQLTCHVDDGCVVYVNGKAVYRYNMPEGATQYNQFSTTYVGGTAYTETVNIDPSAFKIGVNTIAVEVHNANATSSDLYWTASLVLKENINAEDVTSTDPTFDVETLSNIGKSVIEALYEVMDDETLMAKRDSMPFAPIRVNEVSAGNTVYVNEYCKKNDWIELYNNTDTPLNVAGLYISDNPDKPRKYQIPSGRADLNTMIEPGGTLVIWADKLEPLNSAVAVTPLLVTPHTFFKLSNEDGEEVIIMSSDEFVANNPEYFEAHPALVRFADHLVYNAHKGDQSVGRYPDGSNKLYVMNRPTIGKSNASHSYDTFIGMDDGVKVDDMEMAINTVTVDQDIMTVLFVDGYLIVKSQIETTVEVNIYTAQGQLCRKAMVRSGENGKLYVGDLAKGVYVGNVKHEGRKSSGCKFVVK